MHRVDDSLFPGPAVCLTYFYHPCSLCMDVLTVSRDYYYCAPLSSRWDRTRICKTLPQQQTADRNLPKQAYNINLRIMSFKALCRDFASTLSCFCTAGSPRPSAAKTADMIQDDVTLSRIAMRHCIITTVCNDSDLRMPDACRPSRRAEIEVTIPPGGGEVGKRGKIRFGLPCTVGPETAQLLLYL